MTKLKHFAFSFALAGALAFGMGTVTKAAEPASGTTITAPAAKTDISQSKDLSINWKNTSKEYLFEGKIIEPEVIVTQTITENGTTKTVTWTKDTDYAVKYTNNNKVSSKVNEAAAIITPIGEKANSYSGSKTLNFTIKQDISKADSGITASFKDAKTTYTYTAPANTPEVNVAEKTTVNGKETTTSWKKDTDYVISFTDNTNVTTAAKPATVIITPKAGSKKAELYGGSITLAFQITPCDINDSQMKMTDHYDKVYSRKAYKAGVKLVYTNKNTAKTTTLVRKKDYTISNYTNNINVGTATGVVKGIGNYSGETKVVFTIKKAKQVIKTSVYQKAYKASALKKSKKKFALKPKAVSKKFTYTVKGKKAKKYISVNKKGKVTIKKGIKKGIYKVVIKTKATKNHKAGKKTVRIVIE